MNLHKISIINNCLLLYFIDFFLLIEGQSLKKDGGNKKRTPPDPLFKTRGGNFVSLLFFLKRGKEELHKIGLFYQKHKFLKCPKSPFF